MTTAKNNIRRLSESGHVLVREDGKWKIIDSLGPQVKKKPKGPPPVNA
tara:strand:+ start:843 stop:986 length:144 start_codon:yes stop_codon:yes gene_type:complete